MQTFQTACVLYQTRFLLAGTGEADGVNAVFVFCIPCLFFNFRFDMSGYFFGLRKGKTKR